MLEFERCTLETLQKMLPYIRRCPFLCSDLSAGTLFMWQEGAEIQFCVRNDTFMVRQNIGEQPAFSWPYGADPDGMIDALLEYVRENDLALRFFAVNGETLERIRRDPRLQPAMAAFDPKWSDYIYSFEDAAAFRGRKFSGQRNHINKFRKLYGEPVVRPLTWRDRSAVERLLEEYAAEHADGNALERIELDRARRLLDVHDRLGLTAACLTVGDEIAAFGIGEIVGDALMIHVEKALRRFEGAYPTMYQGLVRHVWETLGRPLRIVNREDDSGDPGLRTSKRQYQPIGMVDKHLVHVDSPAARIGAPPVLSRDGVVLTAFREDDRDAYLRLNTDVENNRWWGYDYREDVGITAPVDRDTFYDGALYDMRAGDSVNFAVRPSEDGPMIGEVILWRFTSGGSVELGCRLFPEYQGRGRGRAAFGAAVGFAEALGLRPTARCFRENAASRRMIVASGLSLAREDDQYYYFDRRAGAREAPGLREMIGYEK